MNEKKKNTAKIVDKSSINYTFTDENLLYNKSDKKKGENQNSKKDAKTSIKDIKNQNRHKVTSKNIRSLQGHSPVYE